MIRIGSKMSYRRWLSTFLLIAAVIGLCQSSQAKHHNKYGSDSDKANKLDSASRHSNIEGTEFGASLMSRPEEKILFGGDYERPDLQIKDDERPKVLARAEGGSAAPGLGDGSSRSLQAAAIKEKAQAALLQVAQFRSKDKPPPPAVGSSSSSLVSTQPPTPPQTMMPPSYPVLQLQQMPPAYTPFPPQQSNPSPVPAYPSPQPPKPANPTPPPLPNNPLPGLSPSSSGPLPPLPATVSYPLFVSVSATSSALPNSDCTLLATLVNNVLMNNSATAVFTCQSASPYSVFVSATTKNKSDINQLFGAIALTASVRVIASVLGLPCGDVLSASSTATAQTSSYAVQCSPPPPSPPQPPFPSPPFPPPPLPSPPQPPNLPPSPVPPLPQVPPSPPTPSPPSPPPEPSPPSPMPPPLLPPSPLPPSPPLPSPPVPSPPPPPCNLTITIVRESNASSPFTALDCNTFAKMSTAVWLENIYSIVSFQCSSYNKTVLQVSQCGGPMTGTDYFPFYSIDIARARAVA
ncbi:hypothetical protein CEUSTIGMA_g13975.t1 [Chlamydomonas eustigma]|uniref:Pherophorin domain-containing protein n=1 Tax=Chlamydomonas eustigma TaxID=1157962 RepID=A0A250XU46_9CHLO|nr:hypothetical protein CEUSTIGMA_g13975.t1 [Chlamydomonas eustigma]|eukprot:GAX86568.1 hypothetical protein CEUSTIGMA_g13975.t1 [Chlamydomonas eustigma]